MTGSTGKNLESHLARLIWLTLGLAPLVLAGIVSFLWVKSNVPAWVYWKMGLIFLIATEVLFIVGVVLAVLGAMLAGASLLRRGGERNRRLATARWFVLCLSILLALTLAEAVSSCWQRTSRQSRVMPVGGLHGSGHADPSTRVALPPASVILPTRFPDPPGDPDLDVVVVGESSAEGVPYQDWLSIGQIVQWQLGEVFPDRHIRLRINARSGETLEEQHRRLADLE